MVNLRNDSQLIAREFGTASRRQRAVVGGVAVGFAALHVTLYLLGERSAGPLGSAAGLVLNLVVDFALLFQSRFPRVVAALAFAAAAVQSIGDSVTPGLIAPAAQLTPTTVPMAVSVVVWLTCTLLPPRESLTWVAAFAVLAVKPWQPSWLTVFAGLVTVVAAAVLAFYFRARRELLQSLRERAESAEREQRLLAEQARAAERQQLIAEIHDIITHHITEIVLHAGSLQMSTKDLEARVGAQQIRDAGARALEELRDLVRVTHTGATPSPVSSDEDIRGDLVRLADTAGAELSITGDAEILPPVIARTAYRVVQESLTNARKHAPGARVSVTLRCRPETLHVEVVNSAPTGSADPMLASSGAGVGLPGLRRRVRLLGGALDAEPTNDNGFRVSVRLPTFVPDAIES